MNYWIRSSVFRWCQDTIYSTVLPACSSTQLQDLNFNELSCPSREFLELDEEAKRLGVGVKAWVTKIAKEEEEGCQN